MMNVVLLSEINPIRYQYGWFNPFDPLQHFQAHYPQLHYSDNDALQKMFMDRLFWIVKKCRENSQFLILRDHSHTDFLEATFFFYTCALYVSITVLHRQTDCHSAKSNRFIPGVEVKYRLSDRCQ